MRTRENIDHLFGKVVGMLLQQNRVLDRAALLGIRDQTQRCVVDTEGRGVVWCENLTAVHASMIVDNWEGKLPKHQNPG